MEANSATAMPPAATSMAKARAERVLKGLRTLADTSGVVEDYSIRKLADTMATSTRLVQDGLQQLQRDGRVKVEQKRTAGGLVIANRYVIQPTQSPGANTPGDV